jgi:hypothetical protein
LQAFRLPEAGYMPITISDGRFMIPELGSGLGLWYGELHGCTRQWVGFFDAAGQWILTPVEMAQRRTDRLAELLRAQGIDPEQV